MSASWISILTFAATALLVGAVASVAYDFFLRYRSLLHERLDELSGKSLKDSNASVLDLKQLEKQASKNRSNWRMRLQNMIAQAGLQISVARLASLSCALGVALGIVAAVVAKRWWAFPVGLIPGAAVPILYIRLRRNRRIRKLVVQLPDAFDMMGRIVRAGQTVPAALQIIADDFEPPISEEFRRCCDQQNFGISFEAALRDLARRSGVMELRILVVALLVQARSGGNLAELVKNLATMVRTRLKLHQKLRAMTGEGRMQATVLIVLPTLAFACMLVLSPDYATTLVERPGLLIGTLVAQLAGAFWIRRIISFEA
jgi:tight adherence protein B